ncbi:MAG: superoxide dismutase [Flavobacteriaceae bacterium]
MAFELPPLPYAYDALEPHIDKSTIDIHQFKHQNGYTSNLNNAIAGTPQENMGIEEILTTLSMDQAALRNNGGGYYNHNLFWESMHPQGGGIPQGALAEAINTSFGSFEGFKDAFAKAAATRFGSGWAWLCVHPGGKLEVCSSANQDNPLMPGIGCGGTPILGLDVWEHAYYLNYQNRRPDYIQAFFNVIHWDKVAERFANGQ